jgi:hypothetical protein
MGRSLILHYICASCASRRGFKGDSALQMRWLISYRPLFILMVACIYCGACSRQSAPLAKLPSGKQINITREKIIHFPNGTDALVLSCETDISIDNMSDLRKEADEVWTMFSNTVESVGMTNGVIRMTHPEAGRLVTLGKSYDFVFEKRSDGQWHCLQDKR